MIPHRFKLLRSLSVPVIASIVVHGVMLGALATVVLAPPRRAQLVDSPTTLSLTIPNEQALTQPPQQQDQPQPTPPKPEPQADATPEPPPAAPSTPATLIEPIAAAAPVVPVRAAPAPTVTAPTATQRTAAPVQAAPQEPTPAPVSFAGVEGQRAERVVYVLDASAAMTTSLTLVKDELLRSIERLERSQKFQVVVFRTSPRGEDFSEFFTPNASSGRALCPATDENKARLAAWLDTIQPVGASDPLPGMRAALSLDPELVFLLTRSIRRTGGVWGVGVEATLAELDRLNPRSGLLRQRRTVIKAVQFIDDDPTGLLAKIAEAHGDGANSYRVLTTDELRSR